MLKSKKRLVELTIAAVALIGVILVVCQTDLSAAFSMFSYYTIQTNILVAVFMIWRALYYRRESSCQDIAITSVTIWIFITGIGYHFLISSLHTPSGFAVLSNILIHYVTPVSMVIYYLISPACQKKGVLNWLSYPVLYLSLSLIRGAVDGFYPYWFLRPSDNYPDGIGSYPNVLIFALGMALLYLATGYLLHGARNRLSRLQKSVEYH